MADRSRGPSQLVGCGVYVVGPSHYLMLRRIERPIRFDPFPSRPGGTSGSSTPAVNWWSTYAFAPFRRQATPLPPWNG